MGEIEAPSSAIRRLFDETRRRLVETGTRNRLVHVNRQSRRSNVLDIVNERSDDVYSLLVAGGRTMRFLATGRDKSDDTDTPSLAAMAEDEVGAERYTDNQLETRLGPDGLQKRLLKLARDAQTAEEEQGVNILYLALGFLSWFEDQTSQVKREAPLILVPVELTRNSRTSSYDIKARDDDIVTNLPLQERLKADFGIKLPEVEPGDDWLPSDYFHRVAESVAAKERWSIDPDGMQLGFFSFAKLLMYRDLDAGNWPGQSLAGHPLTRGLLYEGFEPEEPLFGKEDRLDEVLSPSDLFHVVDADASQTKVIEEVRKGRNLVVQGPPGTGKSQTITNIIAAAVQDGKRVLFVAEKMAALSVVHHNLTRVGLADIGLELHSKTANKRMVLAELARTLNAGQAVPAIPPPPEALRTSRDELNKIAAELHGPVGSSGESAHSVLAQQVRFIGRSAPPPNSEIPDVEKIDRAGAARIAETIRRYAAALKDTVARTDHPFLAVENLGLQPTDLARLEPRLRGASTAALRLADAIDATAEAIGVPAVESLDVVPSLLDQLDRLAESPSIGRTTLVRLFDLNDKARLHETLEVGAAWRSARDEGEGVFADSAWETDAAPLRQPIVAGQSSFFTRWGSAYRSASRQLAGLIKHPLPKSAFERTDLIDQLLNIRALHRSWREDENWAAGAVGDDWRGEKTPFAMLLSALGWCDRAADGPLPVTGDKAVILATEPELRLKLREKLADAFHEAGSIMASVVSELELDAEVAFGASGLQSIPLRAASEKLVAMASALDRYDEWTRLTRLRNTLIADHLANLVARLDDGSLDGNAGATEFLFARAEAIWKVALSANPAIAELRDANRHAIVEEFANLEKSRLKDCVTTIRANHLRQLPQGARGAMAVIRGEIAKRRAHMPLRKLFSSAAEAIQRIKPVLLMSPISVAQFLPPGAIEFDLLLIDEASQVRPEDALGAIARTDQIVVVGDQKQLPPSAFFDRLSSNVSETDDEEEDAGETELLSGAARVGEMESILTLCEARGLSPRMLEWHYRSRDPSLIRVSNREFYRDGLVLPPSPLQDDPGYGLIFTRVAGAYDRGGKRDNRIEGSEVVKRVVEHANNTPTLSLGVVTFSSAQRNLITELLEYERRRNAVLDNFLREGGTEDVFVKNIENVQGDERDVILISVGYGPTQPGAALLNMNFGPINGEGGERRLNVLFTRARLRCEVFASFDPGDIDLSKVTKDGPRILKSYLEFAKTGLIDDKAPTGADADTPFESDVADVISRLGYPVDHQVGSAGFLIDLGVRHPQRAGTYVLAVECDGATYHSALWARERDRLRQGVLEHLGWHFHRIWSTDWFYRRQAEIDRLKSALEAAVRDSDDGISITGANELREPRPVAAPATPTVFEIPEVKQRKMPHYVRSQVSVNSYQEPHNADSRLLARLVAQIIEDEGPIHEEEVARRIASAFGKERAGGRIFDVTKRALRTALRASEGALKHEDSFWCTAVQEKAPTVRDRSRETGNLCKAAFIAMSEVIEAVRIAMEDNAGGSDQEIIRAATQLFGFKRVGPDLQARLEAALYMLR